MCGLVTVLSKKNKPAGQYAFELYQKQAARGKDGFGYVAIKDGSITNVARAKTETVIRSMLMKEKADLIMFHHRLPTSTDNTIGTTHPMFVSHEELEFDYYFAHNGVITNALFLKGKHDKLGYKYLTEHKIIEVAEYTHGHDPEYLSAPVTKFNDSETLAIELARFIEGKAGTVDTSGGAAFWGVAVHKGSNKVHKVYFGKNYGRDLCWFANKKWFSVTSETGQDLNEMELNTMDLSTLNIEQTPLLIDAAKPVVTTVKPYVGFHRDDYDILEFKDYTRSEAEATGYAMTHFTSKWKDGHIVYVPSKFVPARQVTLPLPPGELDNNDDELDPKAVERLDNLANEHAKTLAKRDKLEEEVYTGTLDSAFYEQEMSKYEIALTRLEDEMSSLGLPQDVVEETMELAQQLEDYNDSFTNLPFTRTID